MLRNFEVLLLISFKNFHEKAFLQKSNLEENNKLTEYVNESHVWNKKLKV